MKKGKNTFYNDYLSVLKMEFLCVSVDYVNLK